MKQLSEFLNGIKSVAIAGHVKPDGDSIGSCLALYNYIKDRYPMIQADVYLQPVGEIFHFIKNIDCIQNIYDSERKYDLFVSLDCGDRNRLGKAAGYLDTATQSINIDHHISNSMFADHNHVVADASSTCEVLYSLLEEEYITKEIAEALYVGIITDSGVFQYQATSSKTMNIAGKLMDKGIDFSWIVETVFFEKTYLQNQILGRALLESMMFLDNRCIVSVITQKEMDFYGVDSSDLEGIVSQLRNTTGIEVALFLYEIEPLQFKVSMRSHDIVDVSRIAQVFGGGGHVRAAGCTMCGTVHDVINNITAYIEKQLQ